MGSEKKDRVWIGGIEYINSKELPDGSLVLVPFSKSKMEVGLDRRCKELGYLGEGEGKYRAGYLDAIKDVSIWFNDQHAWKSSVLYLDFKIWMGE